MNANMLADDELNASQPDTVIGAHGSPERQVRIAEIDHDRHARAAPRRSIVGMPRRDHRRRGHRESSRVVRQTCRRQVLRSRRAPNRHGDACAILFLKALVRFRYLGVQRACSSRRMDQGAGSCSILGQTPNVVLPKVFEQNAQTVPGPAASRASRSAVAVSANPLGTLTPSEDNAEYSSPNEEFFPPTSATSSDCNSPNQRT